MIRIKVIKHAHKRRVIYWVVSRMKDEAKTKEQLITELAKMRRRNAELKASATQSKRAEQVAREACEYAESIVDTVREPLLALDDDLRVISASRSFYQTFKVTPKETEGQCIYNLGNFQWDIPKLRELLEKIILKHTAFDDFEVEYEFPTIGRRIMLLNARQIRNGANKAKLILLAIKDVTEFKRAEEALRESEKRYMELSITDDLTGLYNSRYFYHQLNLEIERSIRYNHPLSLLLLDVDNFKGYNDKYGHLEGDKVLVKLGELIFACLRKIDSAYRYGGEEFTMILPETGSKGALKVAERLKRVFETERFSPVLTQTVYLTVSIGVAIYQLEEELSLFIQRADKAMYLAKEQGKNRIIFSNTPYLMLTGTNSSGD